MSTLGSNANTVRLDPWDRIHVKVTEPLSRVGVGITIGSKGGEGMWYRGRDRECIYMYIDGNGRL